MAYVSTCVFQCSSCTSLTVMCHVFRCSEWCFCWNKEYIVTSQSNSGYFLAYNFRLFQAPVCLTQRILITVFNAIRFFKEAKEILQTSSVRKVIATTFWYAKGILIIDFMEHGASITSAAYCDTLKRLRAICIKSLWFHPASSPSVWGSHASFPTLSWQLRLKLLLNSPSNNLDDPICHIPNIVNSWRLLLSFLQTYTDTINVSSTVHLDANNAMLVGTQVAIHRAHSIPFHNSQNPFYTTGCNSQMTYPVHCSVSII